jgi:hypothetical protein
MLADVPSKRSQTRGIGIAFSQADADAIHDRRTFGQEEQGTAA